MSDHWKRWRAYFDDVEAALRSAADELAAAERDAAVEHERERWPAGQEAAWAEELCRIALDTPFFGELLRSASRSPGLEMRPRTDTVLRAWDREDAPSRSSRQVDPRALAPPPPGAVAPPRLVRAEKALAARTRSLVPVLENLTIARNASAVMRTAEALGLQELHFVHPAGSLAVQSAVSKRAHEWLDVEQAPQIGPVLDALVARGYRVLAADHDPSALPLEEVALGPRCAVVFGSEQCGVSEQVRTRADALFYVPVAGLTTYLNVSVAAAIALYALDRRLRASGERAPLDRDDTQRLRVRWYRALAGSPMRQAQYLRWLHRPPTVASSSNAVASREKRRAPDARKRS